MKLDPHADDYPPTLLALDEPPVLTVSGPLEARRVIAIVGSRAATEEALDFAFALAYHLARAGVTIVSGGAVGIDKVAHEGAMHGDGATWSVACGGRDAEPFPPENRDLFEAIADSDTSRMIWPFPDDTPKDEFTPRARNAVLVALAECVIVVQAAAQSGSLNAATWADRLRRPLWVVPGQPFDRRFQGTAYLGTNGAIALWSVAQLHQALGLPPADLGDRRAARNPLRTAPPLQRIRGSKTKIPNYRRAPRSTVDPTLWSDEERAVFSSLSEAPTQQDKIIARTGLGASATFTALLTLSLKDVVVEGPDGYFRARKQR